MLVYSSLTTLIFCTDKLIKYFIDKTARLVFGELLLTCCSALLPYSCALRTVNHVGARNDQVETGLPGSSGPIRLTSPP